MPRRHGGSARLATIFLTSDCNMHCSYCYALENKFDSSTSWNTDSFESILDLLAENSYQLSIGGGEPLTHPDLAYALAEKSSKRKIKTALLTNGVLLNESLLIKAKKAGIQWIQISMDSLEQAKRCAAAIKIGHELGIRMAAGTVMIEENIKALGDIHNILIENNAFGWRIFRMTPLGSQQNLSEGSGSKQWIDLLLRMEESPGLKGSPMQIRYEPSILPIEWLVSLPSEMKLEICGGRTSRRIFIYPDGKVYACGLPSQRGKQIGNFLKNRDQFISSLSKKHTISQWPSGSGSLPDRLVDKNYCTRTCMGGCTQVRGKLACDIRCDYKNRLVPVCCFEKLQLSRGPDRQGLIFYPSEIYNSIGSPT